MFVCMRTCFGLIYDVRIRLVDSFFCGRVVDEFSGLILSVQHPVPVKLKHETTTSGCRGVDALFYWFIKWFMILYLPGAFVYALMHKRADTLIRTRKYQHFNSFICTPARRIFTIIFISSHARCVMDICYI